MSSKENKGFVAYPSFPDSIPETINIAVDELNSRFGTQQTITWEKLRVSGKVIINEICTSIVSIR